MTCEEVLLDIQRAAPLLFLALLVAVVALMTQWYDDFVRDRVCQNCADCQRKINGDPAPPPPSSGVPN